MAVSKSGGGLPGCGGWGGTAFIGIGSGMGGVGQLVGRNCARARTGIPNQIETSATPIHHFAIATSPAWFFDCRLPTGVSSPSANRKGFFLSGKNRPPHPQSLAFREDRHFCLSRFDPQGKNAWFLFPIPFPRSDFSGALLQLMARIEIITLFNWGTVW
jgi:hypothetical protein